MQISNTATTTPSTLMQISNTATTTPSTLPPVITVYGVCIPNQINLMQISNTTATTTPSTLPWVITVYGVCIPNQINLMQISNTTATTTPSTLPWVITVYGVCIPNQIGNYNNNSLWILATYFGVSATSPPAKTLTSLSASCCRHSNVICKPSR